MRKMLKKTVTAIGIGAFLLAALVYGADNTSDLMAYTDNVQSDGSLIYYFEEVAVVLPADWKGKFDVVTDGNSATFYHKASHEKWQEKYGQDGGKLFTLSCSVNHDFSELPDFTYIGFSEQSVMNYFMIFPTDFQAYTADESVAREFQQMNAEIDYVKQHAYMLSDGEWVKMAEGYTKEEIQAALAEENYDSLFDVAKSQIQEMGYTIEKTELINGISCAYISAKNEYGIIFMDKTDSVMELVYLNGENVAEDKDALGILHSVKWTE